MTRALLPTLALLAACGDPPKEDTAPPADTASAVVDVDEDGVPAGTDCDDADPYTYPGASEVPYDGRDQDCDGADVTDVDGDGYEGDSIGGPDCNDANPEVHPGAEVVCYDLIDEDCSEEGWSQYDCDEDGFDLDDDCDDEDATVYPAAPDAWYDGVDSDCDTRDDYDQDGDGFRTADVADETGVFGEDCDDLDAARNPDVPEAWNGLDDDCDGGADALSERDASTSWYGDAFVSDVGIGSAFAPVPDLDGDGFDELVVGGMESADGAGRAYVLPYGEAVELVVDTALGSDAGTVGYYGSAVGALRDADGGTLVAVAEAAAATVHLYDGEAIAGGVTLGGVRAASISSTTYYLGGAVDTWVDPDGADALLVASFPVTDGGSFVGVWPAAALVGDVGHGAARWTWEGTSDFYDAAVLSDLDGDGVAEVGIATAGTLGSPRVYATLGSDVAAGVADAETGGYGGFTGPILLSSADDLDGDGYGEVLVADLGDDGAGTGAGRVWVLGGAAALSVGEVGELATASIAGATDAGGLRAHGASDFDGDGFLDVLVCAPGDGASGVAGACSAVGGAALAGGGEHAPGGVGPTFASVTVDDGFGTVARAWDLDHDGDDDLYVGAPGEAGAVYLFQNR